MRAHLVVPAVVLTCLVACGPSLTFTRRAPSKAREHGCRFDILVVGAFPIHHEIGVIDLDAFSVRSLPRLESEFRKAIAERVCQVGGDAVLPGINGNGRYVLATVVKYVDTSAFAPKIAPEPPADAPAERPPPAPTSTTDGGAL
jgi:hypothetical protein